MQAQGRARVLVRLGSRESDFAEHIEVNAPPAPSYVGQAAIPPEFRCFLEKTVCNFLFRSILFLKTDS
jgi:hypothetical protein